MVILLVRNGQLCNRLFTISAFVANSIEYNYPLVCNSFEDYYNKFKSINKNSRVYNVRFLRSSAHIQRLLIKVLYKFISKLPKISNWFGLMIYTDNGSISTPLFTDKAVNKKLFVQGWPFWDVENFIKHSKAIKKIFTPNQGYFDKTNFFIRNLNIEHDMLVGVHLRLGDYKYYLNGRFFFSIETYRKQINNLYLQFVYKGKKPLFIICCNEKIKIDWQVPFSYAISDMDGISDLILLSKCDFIVGPPSTYSMWASFYGDVPYNNFFSGEDVLKLEDFSNIIAPSTFANGRELIDIYEKYSA